MQVNMMLLLEKVYLCQLVLLPQIFAYYIQAPNFNYPTLGSINLAPLDIPPATMQNIDVPEVSYNFNSPFRLIETILSLNFKSEVPSPRSLQFRLPLVSDNYIKR